MKTRMREDVERFAQWQPEALSQRIRWRESVVKQTQHEIAAMKKAQRVQRKAQAAGGDDERA